MKYLLAVGVALAATPAFAHAFKSGADLYAQFGEGLTLPLKDPRLLIAPVALGIAAALHAPREFPRQWAFLLSGIIAGQLIAPFVPPFAVILALVAAIIMAGLGIGLWFGLLDLVALLAGVAVTAAALEGHAFGDVAWLLRIGLVVGISAAAAVPAGLAGMMLERWQGPVPPIALRILLSWCAAIAIMLVAFTWKELL